LKGSKKPGPNMVISNLAIFRLSNFLRNNFKEIISLLYHKFLKFLYFVGYLLTISTFSNIFWHQFYYKGVLKL